MTAYSTNTCVAISSDLRPKTSLWQRLFHVVATHRQRCHLCGLSPELLKDIGLSSQDVARETAKPFWDVPNHWRN